MKPSPLQPGEPPKRKTGLRRSTARQQKAGREAPEARKAASKKRSAMVQPRLKAKLTPAQKAPLVERSGGWCELRIQGVCLVVATDVAHRIGEGMGGRHGAAAEVNDRLSNTLHACRRCHRYCHDYPATARGHGWMLRRTADPLTAPVFYCDRGWVLLDNEGGMTTYESPRDGVA